MVNVNNSIATCFHVITSSCYFLTNTTVKICFMIIYLIVFVSKVTWDITDIFNTLTHQWRILHECKGCIACLYIFFETFSFIENMIWPLKSDLNSYTKHVLLLVAYLTEVPTCGVTVFSALKLWFACIWWYRAHAQEISTACLQTWSCVQAPLLAMSPLSAGWHCHSIRRE
jgi:hypothetical protein